MKSFSEVEILWQIADDARRHQKKLLGDRWEKAEEAMRGKLSRFQGGKAVDDDSWKADTCTNLIWANYLQNLAVLMRDIPRISMTGKEYLHDDLAKAVERKINQNFLENAFSERQEELLYNAYVYGKAWFKLTWDGRMNRGLGAMRIEVPSSKLMLQQPGKIISTDGQYLIQLYEMDKMTLCRTYPEHRDAILSLFTERGHVNPLGGDGTTINPYPGEEGLRTDGTGLTMYYRERGTPPPPSVIMAEFWLIDDEVEERYGWVHGLDRDGKSVYKKKKGLYAKYPAGRMIRVAGNLKLEDAPNPFPCFPYVEMVNVFDGQEWPQGDCDQLIPIQKLYDLERNQQVDGVNAAIGGDKVFYSERAGLDPTTITNDPAERFHAVTDPTQIKEVRAPQVPPALFEATDSVRGDFDRLSGYPEAAANSAGTGDLRSGYAFEVVDEARKGRLKLKTYTLEAAVTNLARLETLYLGMFQTPGDHYSVQENLMGVYPELFNYTVKAGLNLPASRRTTEQFLFNLMDRAATIQSPLQALMLKYVIEQSDLPAKEELMRAVESHIEQIGQMQAMGLPPAEGEAAPPQLGVVNGGMSG